MAARTALAARPARRPAGRYHHGDLRRALLLEAVRTIQTQGASALTLRGVGDRLGVSRTALYRHFADKQALLNEVAADGFRTLRAALLEAWASSPAGRDRMDAMGLAYVRFALTHPSHYRVMFGRDLEHRGPHGDGPDDSADAFQVLVDAIVEQQARGHVRRDDPHQLALYIWAVVHGVAMLALDGLLPTAMDADQLAAFANARIKTGVAA